MSTKEQISAWIKGKVDSACMELIDYRLFRTETLYDVAAGPQDYDTSLCVEILGEARKPMLALTPIDAMFLARALMDAAEYAVVNGYMTKPDNGRV